MSSGHEVQKLLAAGDALRVPGTRTRDPKISKTDKAAAVKVREGRARAKIEVAESKLKYLDEQRQALSMVSTFALLTAHKMESKLIEDPHVNPKAIREVLLLLFIHHALNHCAELRKLFKGQSGSRQSNWRDDDLAPSPQIPTLIDASPSSEYGSSLPPTSSPVSNRSVSSRKRQKPKAKPKVKAKAEGLFDKEVLHWLRRIVKMFALAVRYGEDDRDLQKCLRSLEAHLNFLGATTPPSTPSKSTTPTKFHPLYFNPQPAKRQLLAHARNVHDELYRKILVDNDFVPGKEERQQSADVGAPGVSTQSRLLSRLRTTAASSSGTNLSLLLPSLTPEDLVAVAKRIDEIQVRCSEAVTDLAVRITHLPPTLTEALMSAGKPTCLSSMMPKQPEADSKNHEEESVSSEKEQPEQGAGDNLEAPETPSKRDSDVQTGEIMADSGSSAISSDLREGLSDTSSACGLNELLQGITTPQDLDGIQPHSARLIRAVDSDDEEISEVEAPMSAPTILPARVNVQIVSNLLELFPLHILFLTEILYTLLSTGQWDTGLEQILSNFAYSLDIKPRTYQILLAYTADVVALSVEPKTEMNSGSAEPISPLPSGPKSPSRADLKPSSETTLSRKPIGGLSIVSPTLLRPTTNQKMKALKIVGMAVGVGALSALTAGLAAPAFAAGFGALGIAGTSGLATFLGSAGGAASLASLFGASSASLSGWKYSRRLADIRVFEFVSLNGDIPNHVTDAIAAYVEDVMLWFAQEQSSSMDRAQLDRRSLTRSLSGGGGGRSLLQRSESISRRKLLGVSHIISRQHTKNPLVDQPAFNICIGISGWLKSVADATEPWNCLRDWIGSESFALKWEPQLLTELGTMLVRLVGETVAYQAASVGMQITMAASASLILWPVSILQYAGQIDNTWITCRERAQQAGALLATALCDKSLVGNRPVTLIGYSMGSRVVAYCLRELYDRGEYHRVRNAVLMGLPGSRQKDDWRRMRSVVSGRLINVYCTTDWILAFLYRWMEWGVQVAGLGPVEGVPGVENFDASSIVFSHDNYEKRIADILTMLGLHASVFTRKYPPQACAQQQTPQSPS